MYTLFSAANSPSTATLNPGTTGVPTAEAVAGSSGGLSVMTISLMASAFVLTTCIVAGAAYYVLRKHPPEHYYNHGSSKTKSTGNQSAKSAQSDASTEEPPPPSTLKESRPPSIKSEHSVYYDDIGSDGNQGSSTDL